MSDQLNSGDASQSDQAVQELTNWARDASGLRASLGPQPDEIFDLADQAEIAVEQDFLITGTICAFDKPFSLKLG